MTRHTTQSVSPERRAALNAGAPTAHLTEMLVIDFAQLMIFRGLVVGPKVL